MAAHSSTLAWRIPQTEELSRLQFTGSQRVGHGCATNFPKGMIQEKEMLSTQELELKGRFLEQRTSIMNLIQTWDTKSNFFVMFF